MAVGDLCPNCTQPIVAYEFPLNKVVVNLIRVVDSRGGQCDSRDIVRSGFGSNTSIGAYHGLIEKVGERIWRVTPKGARFLRGKIDLPAWIRVFQKEVYAESEKKISVYQAQDVSTVYRKVSVDNACLEERRTRLVTPTLF